MASQSAWADEYQLFSSEIFKVTEWPEGFPGGYKEDTSDRSKGYSRIQKWQNNYQDRVDAPERNFSIKDPHYARYQAYHQTMGTQLIPLKWFAALETTMVENLEDRKTLADPAVYENYGFIQSDVPSAYLPKVNGVPLELPIGFAISEDPKPTRNLEGFKQPSSKNRVWALKKSSLISVVGNG